MVPNVQGVELQVFLQQSSVCYPHLAGVFQGDMDRFERVFNGTDETAVTLFTALVAAGRMQGIAVAIQSPQMVMYFADIAILLVRKLYALDMSLGTV